MAPPRDTTKILSLILAVRRIMHEEFRHGAGGTPGCSFMQFEALHYLTERRTTFARDLARHFYITPPAATFIIEGMAKAGLVRKAFDRNDRRAVNLSLTRKGDALLRREIKRREKVFGRVFSVLGAGEKKMLARILAKIVERHRVGRRSHHHF